MRPAQLSIILDREFLSAREGIHTPVMLWGPPGVGKSQIVSRVAGRHDVPVIDIRLSQMEPSDLRGIPFRDGNRVEWAIPSMLPDEKRHGECGILFLDEITSCPPSVSVAAYQLILDRRLGEYRVPEGWAIFAAGNRQGDRGVTYAMPSPLANRFSHFEVEANLEDWVNWAFEKGMDERLIGFLRFKPDLLFDFDPSRPAFPSPRSWEFANRALSKFEGDLLLPALQACVGPSAGLELHAFVRNIEKMPDIEAIIEGREASVPEELDIQYAVASALAGRVMKREACAGHVLDYASRLPVRELGIMLVSDMHRFMGQRLFSLPQFSPWANAMAEVLLS